MYIGDTYINLKNKSKNQRKELKELKRLYDEAVANGIKPTSIYGKYTRDDEKGRVTKAQLEKLKNTAYKTIYDSRTLRQQLDDAGLGKRSDAPLPKTSSLLKFHPELQIIGGGKLLDTDTGEIYEDMADYIRKTESDFRKQIEDALNKPSKDDSGYEWVKPSKDTEPEEPDDGFYSGSGDENDRAIVDNFLDSVKPYYRKSTEGTRMAQELYDAMVGFRDKFGDEKTAEMIESMPSQLSSKVQSSNSVDRYEAIEQCLDYLYAYFFDMDYFSDVEEWNE